MDTEQIYGYDGDLQIAWDNTSLACLRTCPRKYYYTNIMGLRPAGANVHLDFGLRYHAALEAYDRRRAAGEDWNTAVTHTVDELAKNSGDFTSDHKVKNRKNLLRSVLGYMDHFKHDPAETLILANGTPAVELSFRFEIDLKAPNGSPYMLAGHLDKLARYQDRLWVLDRKTTSKSFAFDYIQTFKPSGQMCQYTWGSKVVFHPEVQGVIIDACYIAANLDEYSRFPASYTADQLEEWFQNTLFYIKLAEQYHAASYWPQNFEACHVYQGCPFRSVCGRDPSMRDLVIRSDFVVKRWDPLLTREKPE